jgi:hypothetical protein
MRLLEVELRAQLGLNNGNWRRWLVSFASYSDHSLLSLSLSCSLSLPPSLEWPANNSLCNKCCSLKLIYVSWEHWNWHITRGTCVYSVIGRYAVPSKYKHTHTHTSYCADLSSETHKHTHTHLNVQIYPLKHTNTHTHTSYCADLSSETHKHTNTHIVLCRSILWNTQTHTHRTVQIYPLKHTQTHTSYCADLSSETHKHTQRSVKIYTL